MLEVLLVLDVSSVVVVVVVVGGVVFARPTVPGRGKEGCTERQVEKDEIGALRISVKKK